MRGLDEDPQNAKAFKTVKAEGVEFIKSTSWQENFGCVRVAFCETAEGNNETINEMSKSKYFKLYFDGRRQSFINEKTRRKVSQVKILYLDETGQIWAQKVTP